MNLRFSSFSRIEATAGSAIPLDSAVVMDVLRGPVIQGVVQPCLKGIESPRLNLDIFTLLTVSQGVEELVPLLESDPAGLALES